MEKQKQKIIVEFFCGTKSFTKEAERLGCKCFTIDFDKKFNPDLCIDILDFGISMLPEEFRYPDIVWASPPCTEYSKAKSQGVRDLQYADKVVKKTLELKEQLNPEIWIIENPQTGLLKTRKIIQDLPFTDVSYCKYGMPYRKQTRLWNNINLKLMTCKGDCNFIVNGVKGKRHLGSAGCGGKGQGHKISYSNKSYKKIEKYALPTNLVLEILNQCLTKLNNGNDGIPPKPKLV